MCIADYVIFKSSNNKVWKIAVASKQSVQSALQSSSQLQVKSTTNFYVLS